jgi:hypothetical protein
MRLQLPWKCSSQSRLRWFRAAASGLVRLIYPCVTFALNLQSRHAASVKT